MFILEKSESSGPLVEAFLNEERPHAFVGICFNHRMSSPSFLNRFLPAVLYMARSWFIRKSVRGINDFFPLKRELNSSQYRSTTVAAGMSSPTTMLPAAICLMLHMALNGYTFDDSGGSSSDSTRSSKGYPGL